jgi:hypothetical protein
MLRVEELEPIASPTGLTLDLWTPFASAAPWRPLPLAEAGMDRVANVPVMQPATEPAQRSRPIPVPNHEPATGVIRHVLLPWQSPTVIPVPPAQAVIVDSPTAHKNGYTNGIVYDLAPDLGVPWTIADGAKAANTFIQQQWEAAGEPAGGIDVVIFATGSRGVDWDRGFYLGQDWLSHDNDAVHELTDGLGGRVRKLTILAGYLGRDPERSTIIAIGRGLHEPGGHPVIVEAYDGPLYYVPAYGGKVGDKWHPEPHLGTYGDTGIVSVTVD